MFIMAAGTRFACLGRLANASKACTRGLKFFEGQVAREKSLLLVQHAGGNPLCLVYRSAGFFNRLSADNLWDGVFGVSNAGRKRGRAKLRGGRRRVNLNKGQRIGEGESNIVWPGLNAPVIKGKELVKMKQLPPDPQRKERIAESRDGGTKFRSFKLPPLQRGWTGNKMTGTSFGPPDPVGDYTFDGFDSRLLEFKMVTNMTGNLGKKIRFSAFVVVGNKNGLAGFALAKAPNGKAAIRKAKNMAAQRLQYVERFQDHTIFHNFFAKEQQTAIMVRKVAKGHGLVCHRALKTICEVIGIEDLYAKAEGSVGNVQNLTKAFFDGLQKQETHQDLADRVKLHLVEQRPERDYFPVVVASPSGEVSKEGIKEEVMSFENLYFKGRVPLVRKKPEPFYMRHSHWTIKWQQLHRQRNQHDAQRERIVLGFEPKTAEKTFRQKPLKGSRD